MPGQPKHTRTVSVAVTVDPGEIVINPVITWNPSGSGLEYEVKDWNRGFELGDLSEWTAEDAVISEVEPFEGDYCCLLEGTDSKITQTLDVPFPVNGIWTFRFKARSASGTGAVNPIINYTDGTSTTGGAIVPADEWEDIDMLRRDMKAGKIVSGIAIESESGELYIDAVYLVMATEIITGAVEVSQATPENLQAEAVARPMGYEMDGFPKKGSGTTTDTYAVVVEYTVPDEYKYMLAKILVSCPEDVMYRIRWNGTVKSAEVYVTGGIPFTDWFPWGYIKMWSIDGEKIDIQVKYPAGGAAAVCHAELIGEYVKWAFNAPE